MKSVKRRRPWACKWRWDGVKYYRIDYEDGASLYFYYFYWWNWLSKEYRYWGYSEFWYDCPHASFGLWFINFSWSSPWTKMRNEENE